MKTVKVPLFSKTYRNIREEELTDVGAELINGYVDEAGYLVRMPALEFFAMTPSYMVAEAKGIYGLYYHDTLDKIIYVDQIGAFWESDANGDNYNSISAFPYSRYVAYPNFYSFASNGSEIFLASGGYIRYITSDLASYGVIHNMSPNAPTDVSQVVYLDGYLIANQIGTNTFYWSNVNDYNTWDGESYASTSGEVDEIVAMRVINRELYIFGKKTLEKWENDGVTPFARVPGGYFEVGCLSPSLIVPFQDTIYFIDDKRHLTKISNESISRISTNIDRILDTLDLTYASAMSLKFRGNWFLGFSFPESEKFLLFNLLTNDWSEIGYWDSERTRFLYAQIYTSLYVPSTGDQLVAGNPLRELYSYNGLVSKLSSTASVDDWKLYRKTGHITHATNKRKRSNELRIRCSCGNAETGNLSIRWRDDGSSKWSNEHFLSLKEEGNTEFYLRLQRTGIYRSRQYELISSANSPIVIGEAEEDIEVLAW